MKLYVVFVGNLSLFFKILHTFVFNVKKFLLISSLQSKKKYSFTDI